MFDPSWVSGCATGTSCSGGTTFSNLAACEPTTAIDPCAPAPTACGSANNGSDLWFRFYATGTTATISVIQNTSFVAAIQAFAPGADCATLVELGCAVAGGPSGGVQLGLTGLVPGGLYHFRVYGSAPNVSQRTGNFCFCGSTGMSTTPLPVALRLAAMARGGAVALTWTAADASAVAHYEVQRSADAVVFEPLSRIAVQGDATDAAQAFVDHAPLAGTSYYRIVAVGRDGGSENSNVVEAAPDAAEALTIAPNPCIGELRLHATRALQAEILSMDGSRMMVLDVAEGSQAFDLHGLAEGMYLLRDRGTGAVKRFAVLR